MQVVAQFIGFLSMFAISYGRKRYVQGVADEFGLQLASHQSPLTNLFSRHQLKKGEGLYSLRTAACLCTQVVKNIFKSRPLVLLVLKVGV